MLEVLCAMSRIGAFFTVRKRAMVISCAAVFSLIIYSTHFANVLPGINVCFTGEKFFSTLTAFGKRSGVLASPVVRHKINAPTNSSAFISTHQAILSPVTVYYVWCQSHHFEFRHYLSVKSAIQNLKPYNVILYYRYYPHIDDELYNIWLSELQQDFPFLETVEVPSKGCENGKPSMSFIYELANERGGIYLGENTILTRPLPDRHQKTLFSVRKNSGDIDLLVTDEKLSCESDMTLVKLIPINCPLVSALQNTTVLGSCIILDDVIFPKDIWYLKSAFGRFARKLFYGSSELPVLRPSYDELVPNIGHMIWFGGGEMDFLFFLGVLSLLHVARVDTVYIHGDKPPSGYYWSLLKDDPRVVHIPQYGIHMIYGRTVKYVYHKSDVLRAELIYRYGGVYLDVDAVFVRELDQEIRGYDAVGSFDWIDWDLPFPDTINFGVMVGKKKSEFWRLFQESMKWFLDEDFSWNGLRRPYQIMERHPNLIHIDPHLQVICFRLKCHATWWKNYQDITIHQDNRPLDWRKDVYVFHWTDPTPPELKGFDQLLKSDGMFADIGKYILNQSGMTGYFTKKMTVPRGISLRAFVV